jgi:hypothetical protein
MNITFSEFVIRTKMSGHNWILIHSHDTYEIRVVSFDVWLSSGRHSNLDSAAQAVSWELVRQFANL